MSKGTFYPAGSLDDGPVGEQISTNMEKMLFGTEDVGNDNDVDDSDVTKMIYGTAPKS